MKMFSLFVDSSFDYVLHQTNPDNSLVFLKFLNILIDTLLPAWQSLVKPCTGPAVGARKSGDMKFVGFFVHFNAYFACFAFSGTGGVLVQKHSTKIW